MNMVSKVTDVFVDNFSQQPQQVTYSPGRVNLIGDHTDYNDGFVLPAAINFGTYIASSSRDDSIVNVIAHDISDKVYTFDLRNIKNDKHETWSNYIQGSLKYMLEEGLQISGADLVISGNIPQGAGLSSSASLEVAVVHCFTKLYNLETSGVQAALIAQKAENEFVGCNCGIMDQLISALGQQGNAMLLDCENLEYKYTPIPDSLSILVIDSGVQRGLVDSEYNQRREQCFDVAKIFGEKSLRHVSLEKLNNDKNKLTDVLYKRAKHVITENLRTLSAFEAIQEGQLAVLSKLMSQSHRSLRDDFNVSTKEINYLVEKIHDILGDQGGVRMTGGGFGGCVVCLLPKKRVPEVTDVIVKNYFKETGLHASIFECHAVDGPFFNIDNKAV